MGRVSAVQLHEQQSSIVVSSNDHVFIEWYYFNILNLHKIYDCSGTLAFHRLTLLAIYRNFRNYFIMIPLFLFLSQGWLMKERDSSDDLGICSFFDQLHVKEAGWSIFFAKDQIIFVCWLFQINEFSDLINFEKDMSLRISSLHSLHILDADVKLNRISIFTLAVHNQSVGINHYQIIA
jgi:hypothetical protein